MHEGASEQEGSTVIHTRLEYGHHRIGYFSLWRQQGEALTGQDAVVLDWLSVQISSSLQYHCLYRHGRQTGQTQRVQPSLVLSRDAEATGRITHGHAGNVAHPPDGDWGGRLDLDQPEPVVLVKNVLFDAAHALRSPLSSTKGYSSTLLQLDVTWSLEEYQEFLQTIDHEADELNRAIDYLLDATQEEAATVPLNLAPATVESLFQAAETDLVGKCGLDPVRFECERNLPPVLVDQARLVQAIGYLIRCASRTLTNGDSLRVLASLEESRLCVSIGSAGGEPAVDSPPPASNPDAAGRGDSPLSWVNADLMLTVCGTLP